MSINQTLVHTSSWMPFVRSILAITALSACGDGNSRGEGSYCSNDDSCSEICSRLNECITQEEAVEVRLSWTINQVAPTPAAPSPCGLIDHFEVRFNPVSARDEPAAYAPIPCSLGQALYDRLPGRFVQLQLTALDARQNALDVQVRGIESGSNTLLIDIQL